MKRRPGRPRCGGRVAVLVQGERLDRVPGHGAGEHRAGPVGRREAHLAAGAHGAGDLAEGHRRVVDDLEHPVAEREVEPAVVGRRGQHLVQQVAVALDAADPVADAGGVGAAAQGGERVGAGVDDGDVVAEPGERDGEHPAAAADVEDAQRRARADHRVQRRPDGSAPDGQLLGGRRGGGRRHPGKPSGGGPGHRRPPAARRRRLRRGRCRRRA